MINTSFSSISSSSSSGSGGGVTGGQQIPPTTTAEDLIVSCNGWEFYKNLKYNSLIRLWHACAFGIADKIWTKFQYTQSKDSYNRYTRIFNRTNMNSNNSYYAKGSGGDAEKLWIFIYDIGPSFITFMAMYATSYDAPNFQQGQQKMWTGFVEYFALQPMALLPEFGNGSNLMWSKEASYVFDECLQKNVRIDVPADGDQTYFSINIIDGAYNATLQLNGSFDILTKLTAK